MPNDNYYFLSHMNSFQMTCLMFLIFSKLCLCKTAALCRVPGCHFKWRVATGHQTEGKSHAPAVLFNTSLYSYYYLWECRASYMVWGQNGDYQLKTGLGITQLPFIESVHWPLLMHKHAHQKFLKVWRILIFLICNLRGLMLKCPDYLVCYSLWQVHI